MITTKEKCRTLRNKGFTLGEIIKATKLPKTTIYYRIKDIPLPEYIKGRIKRESTKRINEFNIKIRKGKCIPGRIVIKPRRWTHELIFLIAHFMFDGEIRTRSCIYHNRNEALIKRVSFLMKKVFKLQPRNWLNKKTGVQKLLKDFGINSRIDEKYREIVISRKENLIKFRDKINFSKGIYINPNRKNSIWKKKLEKRVILQRMVASCKK